MGLFSVSKIFGMTIRESADDGSDFTNPDADYRRVFLGEDGQWHAKDSAGTVTTLGGAPTSADYLVGTANGSLSGEIVVGTSPGGELGGTWASPTVDATHSGSAHTDFIAKSFLDAAGDLITASADNTPALLSRGTDGYLLASTGSTIAWEAQMVTVNFIIDGGGSAITTGVKGYIEIPFAGTITAVTTLLDQSGSIVVDIWKDTYANYPPVDADSITASAPPTVSAATKATDSTLTGWTTSITANDILGFNVDSITTATRATIALRIRKT